MQSLYNLIVFNSNRIFHLQNIFCFLTSFVWFSLESLLCGSRMCFIFVLFSSFADISKHFGLLLSVSFSWLVNEPDVALNSNIDCREERQKNICGKELPWYEKKYRKIAQALPRRTHLENLQNEKEEEWSKQTKNAIQNILSN